MKNFSQFWLGMYMLHDSECENGDGHVVQMAVTGGLTKMRETVRCRSFYPGSYS